MNRKPSEFSTPDAERHVIVSDVFVRREPAENEDNDEDDDEDEEDDHARREEEDEDEDDDEDIIGDGYSVRNAPG
jgi:hypothetical protein